MNAPDYLSRLRQKNAEKNAPSPNCINPVKDFMQFVQFVPGAKKVDFSEAAPPPKSGAGGTIAETGTVWLPDQPPDHPHHPDRAYFDGHAQRLHAHGKRNAELLAAYVQHWHLAADAEPVAHRKANKGRYAANTWLRNLTRWPSQ